MDTEVPLSLQETQMDEFESSKVLARKPVQRNVIKFLKVGIVVLFSLLIIGGGAYAFVTSTQKGNGKRPVSTPLAGTAVKETPSPTPEVQFPEEYRVVSDKISLFSSDVLNPSESRTRLNPPSMTTSATFN